MLAATLLLASFLPQGGTETPSPPSNTGRITLPPRTGDRQGEQQPRRRNDPDQFYRDVHDLRRSKPMAVVDEERLLRTLKLDYDDPAMMAVRLSLRCQNDLLHGLMKVIDRYGDETHARELHMQVLSRPMGAVTSAVVKTVVAKSGKAAKDRLFDYMTARYAPVRSAAVELLPMYVAEADVPRLLLLSREPKADIRRKVLSVLGGIDHEQARKRIVQMLTTDPSVAVEACEAAVAQGASIAPALVQIAEKPARGRAYGFVAFTLVMLERATGQELLSKAMVPHLTHELAGADRVQRATCAIALGSFAYRAGDAGAARDADIVEGLLSVVAPEDFVTGLRTLQPVANEVLVKFSGRDFKVQRSAWRGWWEVNRDTFVGLRRSVAVDEESASKAILLWSADPYQLAFHGPAADPNTIVEGYKRYILSPEQMVALVTSLRELGFMQDAELPKTPSVWTIDLRAAGGRILQRLAPASGDATRGARIHRTFANTARAEMWQQYRDPVAQPDAAAFWRVERKWLDTHPGKENERLIWHVLRRLPKLDAVGRSAALTDLQSVPELPKLITEDDALALIKIAEELPSIEKTDHVMLEIALLSSGDLVWRRAIGVLESRVQGAGGELASRLFHLIGPERVAIAVRHKAPAIAIAAMHDVASQRNVTAIPALVERMADPSIEVQRTAIYALGVLRAKEAREGLIRAEPAAPPEVRREIWGALGRIGGAGVPAILKAAMQQPSMDDKLAAMQAMGHSQSPEVARFLAARFVSRSDSQSLFIQRAEVSLRQMGALVAIPALRPHLQMGDGPERERLVLMLGEFQDAKVVQDLIDLLRDPRVEPLAARYLSDITGVDLRNVQNRARVMQAWYADNRRKSPGQWYLAALRPLQIKTALEASHLSPRSGVGAVEELTRLLVEIDQPHLRVMTGTMLRETTGEDFTRGLRHAEDAAVRAVADRYRIHASAMRAAKK